MKRLLAVFLFALASSPMLATAKEQTDPQRPNRWRLEYRDQTGKSTEAVSVDADGNFLPGDNYQTNLGESSHSWKKLWAGSLYVSSGILNVNETFTNLLAGTTDVAKPAGGFFISTRSLEAPTTNNLSGQATTWVTLDINQSTIVPRNLVIYAVVSATANGIAITTTIVSGSATFYGIDNFGKSNFERISFSTTISPFVGGVAASTHTGIGNVAWASISSVTVQITSVTQGTADFDAGTVVRLFIAWGNKIGLANTITAAGDIYQNSNPITTDVTNGTVYFALPPDGSRHYALRYKAKTSTP